MAYVRRHGNQLAIVTGSRNTETKKVEQRVLFTLYSKPEARQALGHSDAIPGARFESLLEHEYPDVRFPWKKIRAAIAKEIDHLPDEYRYRDERLVGAFRENLLAFTRSLAFADPQNLHAVGGLIRDNKLALKYVRDLIDWRITCSRELEENQRTKDTPYFWRFALQRRSVVPPEIEEHAAGLWEKRDLEGAEGAFQLLLDAFPGYVEGWNYLGLIAFERGELELAAERFQKTIELGQKLFSAKLRKSSYWKDHATRPYMRGLRNLSLTFLRLERYEEATRLVDTLDAVCGDDITVSSRRAAIALNTGAWAKAAEQAGRLTQLLPSEAFVEGFARLELGDVARAREVFLYAALNQPRASRLLVGLPAAPPAKSLVEAEDHNAGVDLLRSQRPYLAKHRRSVAFLKALIRDERVASLLRRVEEVQVAWFGNPKADRALFDELGRMQSRAFATERAATLGGKLENAAARTEKRGSGERARTARALH